MTKKIRSIKGAKPAIPTSLVKVDVDLEHLKIGAKSWALVFDQETERYWAKEHVAVDSHAEAMKVAVTLAGLKFGPPTRRELVSLVDDTRYSPAFDHRFFPSCPSSGIFWTRTPYKPIDGYFWIVYAYYGYAYGLRPVDHGFVRAVSAGQ